MSAENHPSNANTLRSGKIDISSLATSSGGGDVVEGVEDELNKLHLDLDAAQEKYVLFIIIVVYSFHFISSSFISLIFISL
jgi:hypothetical protein